MNIAAVRQEIADAVNAMTGPVTCFPYVPSDGDTPFAYVQVESLTYDRTMRNGSEELILTLMIMVSRADDLTGSVLLDDLIWSGGDLSLKTAIEAANGGPGEHALNGYADFVHVTGTDAPPRWFEWGNGTKYLGAGLRIRVIGSGG